MFPDLRAFIHQLRRDRDLVEVAAPVDAHLEVAEVHRRVIAAGGPALLFTNVRGKAFPLVTNLFGTARRAQMAFGDRPLRLIRDIVHLAETILPPTPSKLWEARGLAGELLKVGMRRQRSGPVTEVVTHEFGLDRLPVLTCWPEDGGPFVTLPLVYTTHPDGKGSNLGMYRLHVHDKTTTGMHWQIGKGGGFHYQVAEARGQSLPVTVFLGGPPALMLSAVAPLPENVPKQIEGTWTLRSFTSWVPGGQEHTIKANGRLTYDAFGNIELTGAFEDPADAARAGQQTLTFKGRAVIDPTKKLIVLADLQGNVPPSAVPEEMSPDRVRHYEVSGNTLTLTTRDGDRMLARTVWERTP